MMMNSYCIPGYGQMAILSITNTNTESYMLVPSEKSHYSSYSDSNVFFNKIVDEKKWLPWLKENKILYYLSTGYDTSESEGEFPVVNPIACSFANRGRSATDLTVWILALR